MSLYYLRLSLDNQSSLYISRSGNSQRNILSPEQECFNINRRIRTKNELVREFLNLAILQFLNQVQLASLSFEGSARAAAMSFQIRSKTDIFKVPNFGGIPNVFFGKISSAEKNTVTSCSDHSQSRLPRDRKFKCHEPN